MLFRKYQAFTILITLYLCQVVRCFYRPCLSIDTLDLTSCLCFVCPPAAELLYGADTSLRGKRVYLKK